MSDNGRTRASIRDIMAARAENMTPKQRAELPRDFVAYRPELYNNLITPSYVHGYSLAIEYIQNWFVNKFNKNYFKYIHINGKHVLDDWKHFNNYHIVREKPMLAIVPNVEFDHDREQIDMYGMDQKLLLKRSNYQQSFFKDYELMNFIYMQMKELKMEFNFKIRLNSRSEQLDLYQRMELYFRIGTTQTDHISADFHIPYDIMLNIACNSGFEIKDNTIVDLCSFINYINSHSELPVIYKMRAINQKPEFFIRAKNLRVHISTLDKLQMDDGERVGKLDDNFHIELRCTLTMPIPHFFVYFCQQPITYTMGVNERNSSSIGVYSIHSTEILPQNHLGWNELVVTGYITEPGEKFIDLNPLINEGNGELPLVLNYCKKHGIDPNTFLDICIFRGDVPNRLVSTHMDFDTGIIYFKEPIGDTKKLALYNKLIEEDGDKNTIINLSKQLSYDLDIVIYADRSFMNSVILNINNSYKGNRIDTPGK